MTRLVSHDSWVWWDSMGAIPRARDGFRTTVDSRRRGAWGDATRRTTIVVLESSRRRAWEDSSARARH
jgi:hypothetical protein